MSYKIFICALFILTGILTTTSDIIRTEHEFENGSYYVGTILHQDQGTIEFIVLVQTLGWVGVGVGPHPNMSSADLVIGGIHDTNRSTYHFDMHGTSDGFPTPDTKQLSDWILTDSFLNAEYTGLAYERRLKTLDVNLGQDFEIQDEDLYLIWVYGLNDTIAYHEGKRGFVKVNLFQDNIVTTTRPTPTTTRPTPTILTSSTISPIITTPGQGAVVVTKEHSFGDGDYNLKTEAFNSEGMMVFTLRVKTLGWIGVGVGPNPGMTGADIVIGGVYDNNNTAYYTDMHATGNGPPTADNLPVSDWLLLGAGQSAEENVTTISYMRYFKTSDSNTDQDFEIKNEELYLIMAYGETDTISQHQSNHREFVRVNLRDGSNTQTKCTPSMTLIAVSMSLLILRYTTLEVPKQL